jgi:hypothetical protein
MGCVREDMLLLLLPSLPLLALLDLLFQWRNWLVMERAGWFAEAPEGRRAVAWSFYDGREAKPQI